MKLIKVGIPVYNEEKNILNVLNSFKNQSFKEIEVLISDNHSTDQTPLIVKKFCLDNDNFFYVKPKKKLTSFQNFNFVFEDCQSKYFIWNSGHDLRSKDYIYNCINYMEKNEDTAICYSKMKEEFSEDFLNCGNELTNLSFKDYRQFYNKFNYNYYIYGLIRTEILRKTNLFEDFVGSDVCLTLQILKYGKIKYLENSYTVLGNLKDNSWKKYYKKHLHKENVNLFYDLNIYFVKKVFNAFLSYRINFFEVLLLTKIFCIKNLINYYYYTKEKIKKILW